jgi:hypothetical protein
MSSEENDTVKLLTETLESKVSMVKSVVTCMDTTRITSGETFNTVVFFHLHEIDQNNQLLDFEAMLDVDHQVRFLSLMRILEYMYPMDMWHEWGIRGTCIGSW